MIQSISLNFDWYNNTNTNSTNKTSSSSKFLEQLNTSTTSIEQSSDYLKLDSVSKQEVTSSIENIRKKMNEVIISAKREKK